MSDVLDLLPRVTPANPTVDLAYLRAALVDEIDLSSGSVPSRTKLGRPISNRLTGSSGTMVPGINEDGFYVNTAGDAGRGGSYITANAGAPVVYFSMEFIFYSGGTSAVDQAGVLVAPWDSDMAAGSTVVSRTSLHHTLTQSLYSILNITNVVESPYAIGYYPNGYLELDTVYTFELAVVDQTLYRFLNGELLDTVENVLLADIGHYAGFEIFKNNLTDHEPGIRRLAFSTSNVIARQVRDRYLRNAALSVPVRPSLEFTIRDDFIGGGTAAGGIGQLGWGHSYGSATAASGTVSHPGVRALNTLGVNGLKAFYLGSAANENILHMADFSELTFVFKEAAAGITDQDIRFGLSNDWSSATPTNALYMESLAADATWYFVGRYGSNEVRKDTGVAANTTDWINMRIVKRSSTVHALEVNGVEVATITQADDGVAFPIGGTYQPGNNSVISGGTTRRIDVDYFSMTVEATSR